MSYHKHAQQRPLIDQSPYDLDVSDEEDSFYAVDEGDYLLPPKWRAVITRTSNRIPRRIQRYFILAAPLFFLLLVLWSTFLGPRYSIYKQELRDMDTQPAASFGNNARPEFKDMIHIKELEKEHLPKGGGRLIVVGDVHGCKDELEELLTVVEFKEGKDHLILAGDIIAKGPHSPGVVSLAERLGASCVRGNHEDKVLLFIAEESLYHDPAVPSLEESLKAAADRDEDSHARGQRKLRKLANSFSHSQIAWLQACPVILDVGHIGSLGRVVVVHAGLVPDISLEQQDPFHVMNMRSINLETRVPSEGREGTPWEKFWNHQQKKKPEHERMTVIYGHDKKKERKVHKYSMGLDTGCVNGGKLTAMIIEEGGAYEFMHVSCKGYVD